MKTTSKRRILESWRESHSRLVLAIIITILILLFAFYYWLVRNPAY